jgi:heme/copper-type cytochrome/quinol oxidase subunit 2
MIAIAVAAVLLAMILGLLISYLITRLRFAFFHCLIHNTREIRPGWEIYREQATRFFWLNVGVGLGFLAVVMAIALPFISGFVKLAHETHQGVPFDWGLLLSLILPLIPILILLALAGVLSDLILRDWMLPHYALDDASAGEAWSEVWNNIMAEKKQFLVYVLLRIVLPFIASICVVMILAIPGLAVLGAIAALEYGLHSAFADATGAAAVVGVLLQVFFGLVAFGFTLLASICLGGPLSTGVREYALVFYGGRYPALGNIMYPPPPPPPAFQGTPGIA